MKKIKSSIFFIGLLCIFALLYEGYKEIKQVLNPIIPRSSDGLKEGEREKIIIDSNGDVRKIKRGKDGKTQTEKITTGAEKVELVIREDGTVYYKEKTFGFLFEPGMNLGMDKDAILLGIDARVLYWRNFGLIGGVSVNRGYFNKLRLHGSLSYRLPFNKFRNTSVYAGINTNDSVQIGLRTKF